MKWRYFYEEAFSVVLALLALNVLTVPTMAETEGDDGNDVGYISFLNLSEEELVSRREANRLAYQYLGEQGVMERDGQSFPHRSNIFYDSLDAMLMGLLSGEVDDLDVPDCTAKYLCTTNDQVKQTVFWHPEKADEFSQQLLNHLGNGYSFMMLEQNSDLRDQFDQAIAQMKEDGTLEELIKNHITDAAKSGEPEAIVFEEFDGEPIKVAVTGCLPPMDYVAADGSFAGFNTAILAEIGKRLEKNIELVQVDSIGRALALAQGNVDVVFWTRDGMRGGARPPMNIEDREEGSEPVPPKERKDPDTLKQEKMEELTEEERAIMTAIDESLKPEKYMQRDMPEGTVTTSPYYTDMDVLVTLK